MVQEVKPQRDAAQRASASVAIDRIVTPAPASAGPPPPLPLAGPSGGPKGAARLLYRFMDRVLLAATVDEKVANTFLAVLNMVAKPTALQRPGMLLRILNGARRAS